MVEGFVTDSEKADFKSIVMDHLKNILDITRKPARNLEESNILKLMYAEAVNSFADVLLPFYDKQMQDVAIEYEKNILIADKKYRNETGLLSGNGVVTNYRRFVFNEARKMFRELNLLLKRNDYLKGSVYGEDEDTEEVSEVN